MKFYVFNPQAEAFHRLFDGVIDGGVEVAVFSEAKELETADAGDMLVVIGGGSVEFPGPAYDVARDRGLVVLHASESYAKARAGIHMDVAAKAPEQAAGASAAAQGLVSDKALEPVQEVRDAQDRRVAEQSGE